MPYTLLLFLIFFIIVMFRYIIYGSSYGHHLVLVFIFLKILFIYLFMREREREREREAETQAEGEAGSMQGGSLMWDWIPDLQDHTLG